MAVVNHLNAPLFQRLYLDIDKSTNGENKPVTETDDVTTKRDEDESRDDGKLSAVESGSDDGKSVTNTNGSVPKSTEDHHEEGNDTMEIQELQIAASDEGTASKSPAEVPSANHTTLPSENSDVSKQTDIGENGNEPSENMDSDAERPHTAESGASATPDSETDKDVVISETSPEKASPEDEDVQSEADSDYDHEELTTAGMWDEPVEEKPRYEISQWVYHLQQAEKLWKDAVKTDEWEQLWTDAIAFLDSNAFSSSQMESTGGGPATKPLHFVANKGLVELTRRLLKRNPKDCHVKDQWGCQPLHMATQSSYAETRNEVYKLLLDAGANPNQDDDKPIYWASPFLQMLSGYPDYDAARLFLEYGADVTKKEHIDSKWTSLHLLTLSCKDPKMVKLLVDAGADVNAEDNEGETPLHKLVRHHDCSLELLDAFLEAKVDVNKDDKKSQRPLYEACEAGNLEVAEKLLQHGADIHDTDVEDMTALHIAADNGRKDVVSLLLKHGADPTRLDKKHRTPFYLACGSRDPDVARILADELLQRDPLLIDKPSSSMKTPFRKACARGNLDIAKFLLDYHQEQSTSADINTVDSLLGRSSLHAAAYFGSEPVVAFLLSRDARVDRLDKFDKTPLKLAYENWAQIFDDHSKDESYQSLIIQLIAADRKAAVADTELLHVAAIKGSMPILEKLLHEEPKADPNARDEHGWTAVDYAKQYRKKEAEDLLLARGGTVGQYPSAWKSTNPKKVMLSEDGLEVWQAEASRDLPGFQGLSPPVYLSISPNSC
jgi:ankyrin repeat protein